MTPPERPEVAARDLPDRIVVGANGAYWRDYGDRYSMCPVSEDNDPVVPVAMYVRELSALDVIPLGAYPKRRDQERKGTPGDRWWQDSSMVNGGQSGDEWFIADAATDGDARRLVEAHNATLETAPMAPEPLRGALEPLARWLYAFHSRVRAEADYYSKWPERWEDSSWWQANPDRRQALVDHWMDEARAALEATAPSTPEPALDVERDDAFYKGGPWYRRTVELLRLLSDAAKVQREPCGHSGIGSPGCVMCDPRIYNTLGFGSQSINGTEAHLKLPNEASHAAD